MNILVESEPMTRPLLNGLPLGRPLSTCWTNLLRDVACLPRAAWARRLGGWPKQFLFPSLGLVLAQGAPVGLLLTRCLIDGAWPYCAWLGQELLTDWAAYVYLTLSTSTVFVSLGLLLGAQQDELRKLAITDGLTHLHNRRYFSHRLAKELARARRYRAPLSLLIIDLDWLKTINDSHGHNAGDRAIKAVAAILRSSVRDSDIVARYAGDEFVALLPQTRAAEAMGLARRICQRVRTQRCGPHGIPLSVSIGLADLAAAGLQCEASLFSAADEALYAAKAAGRDSVAAAPACGDGLAMAHADMVGCRDFR